MRKLLICALALGSFAGAAQAADLGLDSMKDPLPDTLTYKGVTVYGTIDVGYSYQTNGAPLSGAFYTGLNYNIFGSKNSREAISSLGENALSQSFVGVKVEESLGYGWTALGKVESGFNPLSGSLADACASLARNNGRPLDQTNSAGDGSRCGQIFNGPAYAGLSNSAYGTLTIGRQNSLDLDLMGNYDPMGLSYAFSLIGWSGGAGGGVGSTETARWDNSVKYLYQYGPVHAGVMYANGGDDTAIQNQAYAFTAGGTWRGLSVDAVYTKEAGAFNASTPQPSSSTAGAAVPQGNFLTGNFEDNEAWTVGAKYTLDLGGSFKDDGPGAKLTFFGGYQHTDISNPSDPVMSTNPTTIGGYGIFFANAGAQLAANQLFTTDRILQTEWAGAKYESGPWSFTGAYYHISQNSYVRSGVDCAHATPSATGVKTPTQCSGDSNTVSGLVDYAFNKHFDVYAGVAWNDVSGGLANGFLATDNTLFSTGLRLKF